MKGSVALYSMQSLNPGSRSTISHHLVFPFSGSAITGPIGKECADLWPRIASAANAIVWNQDLGKFRVLCAPYLGLPDAVLYLNIYCNVLASYLFLKCYMIIELKWKVSEMLYRVVCLGLGLHMCFHDSSFLRLFSNVSGDDFLQVTNGNLQIDGSGYATHLWSQKLSFYNEGI